MSFDIEATTSRGQEATNPVRGSEPTTFGFNADVFEYVKSASIDGGIPSSEPHVSFKSTTVASAATSPMATLPLPNLAGPSGPPFASRAIRRALIVRSSVCRR